MNDDVYEMVIKWIVRRVEQCLESRLEDRIRSAITKDNLEEWISNDSDVETITIKYDVDIELDTATLREVARRFTEVMWL